MSHTVHIHFCAQDRELVEQALLEPQDEIRKAINSAVMEHYEPQSENVVLLDPPREAVFEDEPPQVSQAMLRIVRFFEDTLKVTVLMVVIYLALQIGSAFIPGGAVAHVLGGAR
jgi:hypothetical protein